VAIAVQLTFQYASVKRFHLTQFMSGDSASDSWGPRSICPSASAGINRSVGPRWWC